MLHENFKLHLAGSIGANADNRAYGRRCCRWAASATCLFACAQGLGRDATREEGAAVANCDTATQKVLGRGKRNAVVVHAAV